MRGGVWGKDHDVLEGHPRTGGLLPPMTHLGPAAPAGLVRYGRDLLCAQFNMRKVSRHELEASGATWRTVDSDFLVCDHPDFHPTDVLQAPDGSVLVIDTGGWYKLCCPTSQLAKPEVLGAIYRLRKKGGEVPVAAPSSSLATMPFHRQRKEAEEIGRQRLKTAILALFEALAAPEVDRFLFHAYTYALLEIGDPVSTREGLAREHPAARAAVLYALEQMPDGGLREADVAPHFGAADERLREAALFVAARHPEWTDGPAAWVREQLARPDAGGETLRQTLLALKSHPGLRELIGTELTNARSTAARAQLLGLMSALAPKSLPESWRPGLASALADDGTPAQAAALDVLAHATTAERVFCHDTLAVLAVNPDIGVHPRLRALALLERRSLEPETFDFVLDHLRQPVTAATAARVLSGARLDAAQLVALAEVFPEAGLMERPLLLKCFAGATDETAGLALVAALEKSGALAALAEDARREIFAHFPERVQATLADARAKSAVPDHAARLDELERTLPAGDAARGQVVFQSAPAACATCHPLGYKGGHLGPDLSKVGAIRARRDLLEAVVFPSASFVRSYEPVLITSHDESVVYGIVTNQGRDTLTVATGAATPETQVPLADIKSMTPGAFSLMPQGIDHILKPEELADLIAFLQSCQ